MAKDAKWYAGWVRLANAQSADEKLTNLETAEFIENLAAELEAVKRERDALKRDLYFECQDSLHACCICKFGKERPCERAKERDDCFVWRGLCKENGGATDD